MTWRQMQSVSDRGLKLCSSQRLLKYNYAHISMKMGYCWAGNLHTSNKSMFYWADFIKTQFVSSWCLFCRKSSSWRKYLVCDHDEGDDVQQQASLFSLLNQTLWSLKSCLSSLPYSETVEDSLYWYGLIPQCIFRQYIESMHSWPRISQTQTCSVCNNRQLIIWSSDLKQCICLKFAASHIFIEQRRQGSES